jgi:hypothetical protein
MGRYYIDCEFDGHNGALLSVAIVRDDGLATSLHLTIRAIAYDSWVIKNVVPLLDSHDATMDAANVFPDAVGAFLRQFIGDDPQPIIVADSPVDIGRFCQAISTGGDGGWASTSYERMTFIVENVDCYPTDLPGAIQHNAWWDAMALRHKLATPTQEGAG